MDWWKGDPANAADAIYGLTVRRTRRSLFLFVIVMTRDAIFRCPLSLYLVRPSCTTRGTPYISIRFKVNCVPNEFKYGKYRRPRIHTYIIKRRRLKTDESPPRIFTRNGNDKF